MQASLEMQNGVPELCDDFGGNALDAHKWLNPDPGWQGRHPGFFATHNVAVRDFPDWFGLPDPSELPATFRIEYFRAWRYPELDQNSPCKRSVESMDRKR